MSESSMSRAGDGFNAWVIVGLGLAAPFGLGALTLLGVVNSENIWLFVVTVFPAALILNHGNRVMVFLPSEYMDSLQRGRYKYENDSDNNFRPVLAAELAKYYGPRSLWINYGLPYLLTLIAGWILAYFLCVPEVIQKRLSDDVYRAAMLGGVGAYVQVLMTLSMRTFRRDISPGAAIWGGVNLILGPILGGVLSVVLADSVQITDFTRDVFYFFAGLAPRQIVETIDSLVRRFWDKQSGVTEGPRLLPLRHVRGITPEVETRLEEEGITDAYMLAMANPVLLSRNTPYDDRQIYAWIDEALLMSIFPTEYRTIQHMGIPGAIDFAYLWWLSADEEADECKPEPVNSKQDEQKNDDAKRPEAKEDTHKKSPGDPAQQTRLIISGDQDAKNTMKKLGEVTKVPEAALRNAARRMSEDAQVQLIWGLYQLGRTDGMSENDRDSSTTRSKLSVTK